MVKEKMIEKDELENIKVYSLTDEMKAIIFAVQKLLKQYPKNNGKVYVSNINIFLKDKRNFKKIDEEFHRQFDCTKEQIEVIISRLDEIGIVHKYIGPRRATYVTLDDEAYIKYFHLEPPVDKELFFLKVLMRLNSRCAIHTISDILIQNKSSFDDIDPIHWLDNYFVKRRVIVDDDELNGLVKFLTKQKVLEVLLEGFIKLTQKGHNLYLEKLRDEENFKFVLQV